jgi:hypothetical protein
MAVVVRGVSTEQREGAIGSDFKREYVVTYLVHTTDFDDGPQKIIDSPDIPSFGDRYSLGSDDDMFALASEINVNQRDTPDEWEVRVVYRTISFAGVTPGAGAAPTDMAPKISASTRTRSVVIPGRYQDPRNANPDVGFDLGVHNSAGQHFDPPPEIEIDEPVLTIRRNVRTVNWPFLMSITNAVNESEFFGCPARTLKFSTPNIESSVDSETGEYWILTYSLIYKYDTWDVQILNRGTYFITEIVSPSDEQEPEAFEEDDGRGFYGLLKIDGLPLNNSSAAWRGKYKPDGSGDPPTFQRFRVYREIDFNTLGIL